MGRIDHPCFQEKDGEVFYEETLLKGVSPQGFKVIVDDTYPMYLQDNKGVWFFSQYGAKNWTRFLSDDTGNFEVLDRYYAKDSTKVFENGSLIATAHAPSFKVVNRNFATDDHAVYVNGGTAEGLQIWTDFDADNVAFFEAEPGLGGVFCDRFNLYKFNHHFVQYSNPHHPRYQQHKNTMRVKQPRTTAWWNLADDFAERLQPLGHHYFTDGKFVFYGFDKNQNYCPQYEHPLRDAAYLILPNADPASFVALSDYYGKDQRQVFCLSKAITADVASFSNLDDAFGRDQNGLWYNGFLTADIDFEQVELLVSHDSAFVRDSFRLFSVKHNARIGKHLGYAHQLKLQKQGDARTFEILSPAFAKDKHQVYWYGQVWKIADPASFELLFTNEYSEYARDKNHLFQAEGKKVLKNIDAKSFNKLNNFWGKDKNNIIYINSTVEVKRHIDFATFEILDDKGAAQDKNKRYWVDGYLRAQKHTENNA